MSVTISCCWFSYTRYQCLSLLAHLLLGFLLNCCGCCGLSLCIIVVNSCWLMGTGWPAACRCFSHWWITTHPWYCFNTKLTSATLTFAPSATLIFTRRSIEERETSERSSGVNWARISMTFLISSDLPDVPIPGRKLFHPVTPLSSAVLLMNEENWSKL